MLLTETQSAQLSNRAINLAQKQSCETSSPENAAKTICHNLFYGIFRIGDEGYSRERLEMIAKFAGGIIIDSRIPDELLPIELRNNYTVHLVYDPATMTNGFLFCDMNFGVVTVYTGDISKTGFNLGNIKADSEQSCTIYPIYDLEDPAQHAYSKSYRKALGLRRLPPHKEPITPIKFVAGLIGLIKYGDGIVTTPLPKINLRQPTRRQVLILLGTTAADLALASCNPEQVTPKPVEDDYEDEVFTPVPAGDQVPTSSSSSEHETIPEGEILTVEDLPADIISKRIGLIKSTYLYRIITDAHGNLYAYPDYDTSSSQRFHQAYHYKSDDIVIITANHIVPSPIGCCLPMYEGDTIELVMIDSDGSSIPAAFILENPVSETTVEEITPLPLRLSYEEFNKLGSIDAIYWFILDHELNKTFQIGPGAQALAYRDIQEQNSSFLPISGGLEGLMLYEPYVLPDIHAEILDRHTPLPAGIPNGSRGIWIESSSQDTSHAVSPNSYYNIAIRVAYIDPDGNQIPIHEGTVRSFDHPIGVSGITVVAGSTGQVEMANVVIAAFHSNLNSSPTFIPGQRIDTANLFMLTDTLLENSVYMSELNSGDIHLDQGENACTSNSLLFAAWSRAAVRLIERGYDPPFAYRNLHKIDSPFTPDRFNLPIYILSYLDGEWREQRINTIEEWFRIAVRESTESHPASILRVGAVEEATFQGAYDMLSEDKGFGASVGIGGANLILENPPNGQPLEILFNISITTVQGLDVITIQAIMATDIPEDTRALIQARNMVAIMHLRQQGLAK